MPSGNSDVLQVMLISLSSKAKCLNLPFILHSRKATERKKKRKSPSKRASKSVPELSIREQMPTSEREFSAKKDAEGRRHVASKTDTKTPH